MVAVSHWQWWCVFHTQPTLCFSMFLIHLMACPWGSTISGQRLLLVTITPFSVEKESEGRPLMFQSRTLAGSARKEAKENSGEEGMASSFTCGEEGWMRGCGDEGGSTEDSAHLKHYYLTNFSKGHNAMIGKICTHK